ncbi:MAG: hypothetical protein RIS64_1102 [Bacteroidota bacterium]
MLYLKTITFAKVDSQTIFFKIGFFVSMNLIALRIPQPFAHYKWFITNILCLLLTLSFGQNLPEKPSPPRLVNDFSNLMTPQEQELLEKELVRYSDSTTTQITVITLPTLDGYEIEPYGVELFRKWGIGTKKNNGILVLVSTDPTRRRANITTGYGMEGVLPDMICKRIIDYQLVPNFKKKAYYDGLLATVKKISQHANGEYVNESFGQKDNGMTDGEVVLMILFIILFIALFIYIMRKGQRTGYQQYGTRQRHYSDDSGPTIFIGGGSSGGGGWDSGGSDDDSGGFGGFGGGDTGGGGASGDWE